jgi:hypothetical protein
LQVAHALFCLFTFFVELITETRGAHQQITNDALLERELFFGQRFLVMHNLVHLLYQFRREYPEALLRIGMFADWFELRIGQNFANQRQTVDGVPTNMSGAQDLYLGMKLALTEQKGILPQVVIIPQMTVPTGSEELTAGRILPGLNVDCGWEVIRHFFRIELLIANNFVQDISTQNTGFQLATGLTAVFELTRSLEMFIEWDAFYPMGRISSDGPRDYAVGGFVYFLTPNLALDARAGVGLNSRSNDFLAGVGFAVRR